MRGKPALGGAPRSELVLGHGPAVPILMGKKGVDPSADPGAAGDRPILVDRPPELVVHTVPRGGRGDRVQHRAQSREPRPQPPEPLGQPARPVREQPPVAVRTLQPNPGNAAQRLPVEVVVRADHIHQRHQHGGGLGGGGGREGRLEQVGRLVPDPRPQRPLHPADRAAPVERRRVVAHGDGLPLSRGVGEQLRIGVRVEPHVHGHLVHDGVPQHIRRQGERQMSREAHVQSPQQQTGRRLHRLRRVGRPAHQSVHTDVVESRRTPRHGPQEPPVADLGDLVGPRSRHGILTERQIDLERHVGPSPIGATHAQGSTQPRPARRCVIRRRAGHAGDRGAPTRTRARAAERADGEHTGTAREFRRPAPARSPPTRTRPGR